MFDTHEYVCASICIHMSIRVRLYASEYVCASICIHMKTSTRTDSNKCVCTIHMYTECVCTIHMYTDALYMVAKTQKMPHLRRSLSAKEPYD